MAAKKKVRVYKGGGAYKYYCGGSVQGDMALPNKQQGGQPSMTQDSQQDDPIPQEKVAKFADWLRNTSEQAIIQRTLDQEMDLIKQVAQAGYSVPGANTQNYGRMNDPNLGAFQRAYDASAMDWTSPIEMMTAGLQNGYMQMNPANPDAQNSKNGQQPPTNTQQVLDPNTKNKLNTFTRDLTNKAQQGQSVPG